MWLTEFFIILGRFLPFYLTNNQKMPGDIILHKCTKFWSFWAVFCHWPSKPKKNKILKKWKKAWRYYHFTLVCNKRQSYDVWFLRNGAQKVEFFVTLDYFWPFYPLPTQKSNIWKNEKKHIETSSFYTSVP